MANKLIAKQWHNATIQNNFVFGKTMELFPDLCRRLLGLILNTKIKEISYPEREKTIEARLDSKGIRLDVYVEERGANRYFDVEMQIAEATKKNFFSILDVKNPVTTVTSVTRGIFWRPDAIYVVTVLVTVKAKTCYHDCYHPQKRLLP